MKTPASIALFSLILLSSCCQTNDSTVSNGYPYAGTAQEIVSKQYFNPVMNSPGFWFWQDTVSLYGTLIRDTQSCLAYFRQFDPSWECDIDFKQYSLSMADADLEYTEADPTPVLKSRVLLDHRRNICLLEIRGRAKYCTGWGFGPRFLNMRDFILIPAVPASYSFRAEKFWPAR